ncbi:MAG: type II toxin-antitoxin system HicB family antitoxin [Bacteroidales bacterium]|nr:type II toxin-antitoxin system HicB family antitoxin [Bacteroidales bacterium]
MKYTILYEKIEEQDFHEDYYYAYVPSLGLTTHGLGLEGAKNAMNDLLTLWIEERKANGEVIKKENESYISSIELEDALFI